MPLTMTVVAAIHDVPLAQCELPVRGNEREERDTETPETQRAVSGMFNRVIFWSLFFFFFISDSEIVNVLPLHGESQRELVKHAHALQQRSCKS